MGQLSHMVSKRGSFLSRRQLQSHSTWYCSAHTSIETTTQEKWRASTTSPSTTYCWYRIIHGGPPSLPSHQRYTTLKHLHILYCQLLKMKVTIDFKRILHLLLLIVLTLTFGGLLIQRYDWKPLSAYGLACSVVCQINNIILKFRDISSVVMNCSSASSFEDVLKTDTRTSSLAAPVSRKKKKGR